MQIRVGLVQLNSNRDIERNLETCRRLAEEGVAAGAQWLLFPENAPFLGSDRDKIAIAEDLSGPLTQAFVDIATNYKVWVSVAGLPERCEKDPENTYNTQVLVNPEGAFAATYRKIHLFDAQVSDEIRYLESGSVEPGDQVVSTEMGFEDGELNVGLSICYDLRFPEMYRELRNRGVEAVTVPSAFTLQTGQAHWHALLKARAIENQVYILAPNQQGLHFGDRASFGNSSVYDPWGKLIVCAPDNECVVTADIDLGYLATVRERMPVQSHRRL